VGQVEQAGRAGQAFALDTLLIFIPSVAVALGSALLSLYLTRPGELQALRDAIRITESDDSADEKATLQRIAPLLVRMRAEGLPTAVAAAVEQSDLIRAGELLQGYTLLFSLSGDERQPAAAGQIRLELMELIPTALRSAALFGTALYFTLFTAGRRGSTPGKRLMGTEVIKLDGRPLRLWERFERFGGYLVSIGTLGIGLLDLWRRSEPASRPRPVAKYGCRDERRGESPGGQSRAIESDRASSAAPHAPAG
jgi:hypothetical protein